jgi:hypothetical protein
MLELVEQGAEVQRRDVSNAGEGAGRQCLGLEVRYSSNGTYRTLYSSELVLTGRTLRFTPLTGTNVLSLLTYMYVCTSSNV